jgi:hypothetical protein
MATKQPSRRIPAQLEALLDWYFERLSDPQIASMLSRLDAGSCARCGAKIGDPHERDCPWHGRVDVGAIRARSGDLEATLRRGAAVGREFKQLSPGERDAIRLAWTFRRLYQWWTNAALNVKRGNGVLLRREEQIVEIAEALAEEIVEQGITRAELAERRDKARARVTQLPEYAAAFATPKDIRELATFYRQEWHRAKRRPACREGLRRLERVWGRGEVW